MSIKTACPECKKPHSFGDDLAGKKVRCKGCDHRFVVTSRDEPDDEDEEERKPKRSKRKTKGAGIPVWMWAVAGGGGLLVVVSLIVVVVAVILSRNHSRPANPGPPKVPVDMQEVLGKDKPDRPGTPVAAAGPHAAILEEFATSWNVAADALAQARDQQSADNSAGRLRQEAGKLEQLTSRLRAAGPSPATEQARLIAIQDRLKPNIGRIEAESRQLQQRLPSMNLTPPAANNLDQAIQTFGNAGKSFVAVAKQNLP